VLLVVCIILFWPRQTSHSLRHKSDWSLEHMPILIKLFDYSDVNDVGGWHYSASKRFHSTSSLKPLTRSKTADYSGLAFGSLKDASPSKFRRKIADDDDLSYEQYKMKLIFKMDRKYISSEYDHHDEFLKLKCRRANFEALYFPTCNDFHEFDLARDHDPELRAVADLSYYDSYRFG